MGRRATWKLLFEMSIKKTAFSEKRSLQGSMKGIVFENELAKLKISQVKLHNIQISGGFCISQQIKWMQMKSFHSQLRQPFLLSFPSENGPVFI